MISMTLINLIWQRINQSMSNLKISFIEKLNLVQWLYGFIYLKKSVLRFLKSIIEQSQQNMSTFTSTIFTSDILSFSLVQTRLEDNFLKIAEQIDRLGIFNEQLEARVNQKIEQIEQRLENDLGNSAVVRLRPNKLQNGPIGEPNTVKADQSMNLNNSRSSNPVRIATKQGNANASERNEAEITKQLNRLNTLIEQQRARIDQLEQAVYFTQKPTVIIASPRDKKVTSPEKSSKTPIAEPNTPKKNQARYQQELSRLQSQINTLQKQMKQLYSKKERQQKANIKLPSKKEVVTIKEGETDEVETNEKKNDDQLNFDKVKEMLEEINFKINRIDGQSMKVGKQLASLAIDRDKHQQQLLSIVQKIKKNETTVAADFKDITTRIDSIGVKRVNRVDRKSILKDHGQINTNLSACIPIDERQEDTKRFEDILQEIEDLKDQVTGIIKEKEQLKRQSQLQKNPNAVLPPIQTTVVQKSNLHSLQNSISSLKKDMNSMRNEIQLIKSRDQINNQILNQSTMNQTATDGKPYFVNKAIDGKDHWKQWAVKLQKVRTQLLSYIKDLDLKISEKEDTVEQLRQVEALVNQNRILTNKKADRSDVQKILKRLETRLNNFIKQSIAQQELASTHDARIARQPWFCLSCDTELKNFSGKQGKYLAKDLLPVKKLNTQNHMVRRSIKEMETK